MTSPDGPAPAAPGRARAARLPRGARRSQLIDAAGTVFVEQGFHASGMDDIAVLAGVSKPVLYQHFDSKRDLYIEVLRHHVDALLGRIRAASTRLCTSSGSIPVLNTSSRLLSAMPILTSTVPALLVVGACHAVIDDACDPG